MAEAVVEFDYDAVNGDELTLHKGAIIKNINMMEGGWWEGEIDGTRGMFPDNFVKVIEKSTQKSSAAPSSATSSSSSSMKSHSQGPVANGDVSLGSSQEMADDKVKKREGGSKKRKMRAKVTFSYSPQNDDELELVVNDTVEVIDQPEEGWWEGIIKGKHGLFPSNFVSVVDEDDVEEPKTETPASGGNTPLEEDKPVKKIKSSGIGHGNIFAGGMPQLRKTPHSMDKDVRNQPKAETHPFALKRMSLRKKENEEKKDEEKKEDKNSAPTDTKGLFKVKVIFDYEPKNADELQLKKGDIVTVTDKDAGDSGWWKGELNGKVGVFPDNFTEEIPEEKTKKKNMPAPVPARPVSGPTRPGSMELKSGSAQKPSVTKQPSQDNIKAASKESNVNGSRHLPPGAKQVLPPPTAGRPQLFNKPSALAKPTAATKPHEVKETSKDSTDSAKTDPKETTFDNIKINSEKLTHMNLSRPKATPNRRPPSTFGNPTTATSSSSNTPLSPLTSPTSTTTTSPSSSIDTVDAPVSHPASHPTSHTSSHADDEPVQPPPWSRDIKKSLRRPPVLQRTQDKPPPSSTSDDTPPLAPRSKHKKLHMSSSLTPIPDNAPLPTPSNTSSSKLADDSAPSKPPSHAPPTKPPSQALPEKPRLPAHDPAPPRPAIDPRPSSDPHPAPKESASSDPPWKTELKNRTNKPSASGSQSAENGSAAPPGRSKASPSQATTTPSSSSSSATATDTSSSAPARPAAGATKAASSITSSSGPAKDAPTSAEVQDLKKEIKLLQETIASLKTEFKKEVKKLMTEVDDEKIHRMKMQVELERIKKVVMEGD